MDYKQKYEQALERAKKLQANAKGLILNKWLYNVFPELLKENENYGKKIRKALINRFNESGELDGIPYDDIRIWLEKQGKQEPDDKAEPKFKVGDCIRHKGTNECYRIVTTDDNYYFCENNHAWTIKSQDCFELVEQNLINKIKPIFEVGDWVVTPNNETKQIEKVIFGNYYFTDKTLYNIIDTDNKGHLWTIQDAKDGDVLVKDSCIFILKEMVNGFQAATTYCALFNNDDGEFYISEPLYSDMGSTRPATKEQCDLLLQKMKEAGYEWDAEKKELKKIKQKLTRWTEEDDVMEQRVQIVICKSSLPASTANPLSDWLKSLKGRLSFHD